MKRKNDNFLIMAVLGVGVYIFMKFSGKKAGNPPALENVYKSDEPLQKSRNTGINPDLRAVHLEYVKADLLRQLSLEQYAQYEKIFKSMTDEELEAVYLYFKDYIVPRSKYQFVASLDPTSPLGLKIKAIGEKYRIFNS